MKEHPWHLPSATTKHYQWFRNLADFHELTLAWLSELHIDKSSHLPHLITRGLGRDVTENLWMLESLTKTKMDPLLDDTHPQDVLGRLEHTVWAVQGWTLINLLERTPLAEKSSLSTLLEQTSWKQGRKLAETRWPLLADREDLRVLLLALNDTPFSAFPATSSFLTKRAIATEVEIELRACPHQTIYPEVKSVADPLCNLHTHWLRGFLYALNNKVSVETETKTPRCTQRWCFV